MKHIITTKQVAERYEVKPQTVRLWVSEGLKPRGTRGRELLFDVHDVVRWLRKNRPNKPIHFLDALWAADNVRD
jgi:phage terminase Nu1 subunit (DNA packaging protein)